MNGTRGIDGTRHDAKAYYEEEARLGLRGQPHGRRVDPRSQFIEQLHSEERRSVIDLGAGPGGDTLELANAGLSAVGVDLAFGNAKLAAERGTTIIPAALDALPLATDSFDAGWCISVLMHIPEHQVETTLAEMVRPLRSGAPLVMGIWGGEREDAIDDYRIAGQRRLFSLRPLELNRSLLETCGEVERCESWGLSEDGQEYQVFVVRVH